MRRLHKLLAFAAAAALLTGALPAAQAAPAAGPAVHYTWNTATSTGLGNQASLPNNVFYDDPSVRARALALRTSTFYEADGPRTFITFSLHNTLGSYTDKSTGNTYRYGLPYRTIPGDGNTYYAIDENLWLELAQMPALDTAGLGAVNLSMDYIWSDAANATNAAFTRGMQIRVSLDGENFLPGYAGVRSVTLLGGGVVTGSTKGLLYRIETEDLLSIPGVAPGDVIRRVRILPNGPCFRSFGAYGTSTISVNTYPTQAAFDAAVPRDAPEMIDLGEETMRAIAVAEAERTAAIAWTSPQDVVITAPNGSGAYATGTYSRTYPAGKNYRGPVYERDIASTREMFASSIVDGVYGYNGAGFVPTESGQNTAYGMDCQTFVYNAISRVTRSDAWSVIGTFADDHTRLLGDLDTAPRPAFSDADIVDYNLTEQIFASYALARAGDLAVHHLTNKSNAVHTRLVKRVSVVYDDDGAIDPDESKMYCTEQTSSIADYGGWSSGTRTESVYTFGQLLTSGYVVYTLTDYADGQVERESVQAVCAPLVKGGSYTDGVHLAFSSNYRIIKYTVSLQDMSDAADLFSRTVYSRSCHVAGANFEDEELNALLADLPNGRYRLRLAVASGPLTNVGQTEAPVTVRDFVFRVGAAPGDLTGDGKVNGKDIVLLQRSVAGGYGVTLDGSAADLTGDGKVNAKDIVLLQRFVAGGYGVTL